MQQLRPSEIERLLKKVEKLKAINYDPLDAFEIIPTQAQFTEAYCGFTLDKWQKDYLLAAPHMSRIAIAASRQSGKSTVTAAFVAWCLIFLPNFTCLVASRSLRQASYFLDKVRQIVLSIIPKKMMLSVNRLSLEFPNGSMIISIPCAQPDAGRGFSPNLVVLDEAAFAPEALFTAIFPSVAATHGAIHMISSPNGRQGRFFEAIEGSAQDVYWSQRVRWMDCPRMTQDQMDIERVAMGDMMFRQEFLSEFVQPQGAFFGHSGVQGLGLFEDQDYSGLDLRDLEEIADEKIPAAEPTADELKGAFDRADRMTRLLFD